MAYNTEEIVTLFEEWLDEQSDAASGKAPRKWFDRKLDGGDMEEKFREIVALADQEAHELYLRSGEDDDLPTSFEQMKARLELLLAQSVLTGYRKRYRAGEESKPVSELDARRYVMYSSKARKSVLATIKNSFEEEEV